MFSVLIVVLNPLWIGLTLRCFFLFSIIFWFWPGFVISYSIKKRKIKKSFQNQLRASLTKYRNFDGKVGIFHIWECFAFQGILDIREHSIIGEKKAWRKIHPNTLEIVQTINLFEYSPKIYDRMWVDETKREIFASSSTLHPPQSLGWSKFPTSVASRLAGL